MSRWEAYSWLSTAAVSPVAMVIVGWFLAVTHTYRSRWRALDILLASLIGAQAVAVGFVGTWAILKLARPSSGSVCSIMIGCFTAARVLQLTTLLSLVVDRALTLQWPYRYRLAARRTQVRYHISVLVVVSVLVGIAATLSLPSELPFPSCSFLPYKLEPRYALLSLSVEGGLVCLLMLGCLTVQALFCRSPSGRHLPLRAPSDLAPIGPNCDSSSAGSSTASRKNTKPLPSSGSPAKGRLVPGVDLRWSTVAIAVLCETLLDFGPSTALSVAGYFFPSAIPHWPLEIIFAWLSIINSIFLAVSVSLIDPNLRASIRSTFCGVRDCDAESDEKILTSSSTLNSALQFPTGGPGHGKAGGAHLFGSSGFPTLDEQKSKQDNFRRGLSPSHIPRLLKTTSSIEKNPHFPFSPTSNSTSASDDFLRGIWVPPPPPTWKSPCRDKDVMKFYGLHSDDNASDRMPSSLSRDKSCASSSDGSKKDSSDIPDDDDDDNHTYSSLGLGDDESEDDLHCNSLTTDANDDFVFHGPTSAKPPLAPVKEYPNETPSTCSTSKFLGGSLESCTRHKPPLHSHFPSPHQNNNPFNIRLSPNKRHSAAAVSYGLGSHGQDSDSAGKRDNKGRPRAGSGSGSMSPVGGYHSRQLMPSGLHIHRVPHKRGPSPSHTPGPLKPTQRAQSMNALDSLGVDVAEDEPQKTKRSESALTLFTLDPYPPYMPLRRPQPAPPKGFRSVTSLLRRNRANSGNTENFFFGSRYPPPDQLPALPPLGPPPTTNSGGSGKPQSNWMMYRQSKAQSASVPDVRHVFVSEYL